MGIIREGWRRFFFKAPGIRFNHFLPFFIVINLLIGITFMVGAPLPNVNSLTLFTVLEDFLPLQAGAIVWGATITAASILHIIWSYTRNVRVGDASSLLGFTAWAYALVIYMFELAPLGILAIAVPQVFFWGWHYVKMKRLDLEVKTGILACIKEKP